MDVKLPGVTQSWVYYPSHMLRMLICVHFFFKCFKSAVECTVVTIIDSVDVTMLAVFGTSRESFCHDLQSSETALFSNLYQSEHTDNRSRGHYSHWKYANFSCYLWMPLIQAWILPTYLYRELLKHFALTERHSWGNSKPAVLKISGNPTLDLVVTCSSF